MRFVSWLECLEKHRERLVALLPKLPPEKRAAKLKEIRKADKGIKAYKASRTPQWRTPQDDRDDFIRQGAN